MFRIRIHLIRIRIQHFRLNANPDSDPIRIQGSDDQKLTKFTAKKILIFFGPKTTIYLSLSPQKRTSSTSTHEIFEFFYTFVSLVGHFCPSGPGFRIRIRIHGSNWIRIRITGTRCRPPEIDSSFVLFFSTLFSRGAIIYGILAIG